MLDYFTHYAVGVAVCYAPLAVADLVLAVYTRRHRR